VKEKKTNMLQVLARRALLVVLDGAIVAFSFYFALLLRADGAVEASWWPHNRALLYANLPWIVAVYLLSFLAGRLYTILWKYAGERDLIRLAGMIAVPTGIVYLVNRCFIHGVLFNSANAMAAVLGWGGVSVHCQIMRHIKTCGTPLPYFFCARLVCAALAALFCEGLLRLFPCPVNTVSLGSVGAPQMFSFSAPAAFAMLLSGAMLILELDTNEEKC